MSVTNQHITQSTASANLADLLERILDKGIVIAGDIKVKIVDIELLTIQLRLVICSVDKAREMGIDWWASNPELSNSQKFETPEPLLEAIDALNLRLDRLESKTQQTGNASPDSNSSIG